MNLAENMNFQPLGLRCDHIGQLTPTKFGQNVVQVSAINFCYGLCGPWVHFQGQNQWNRSKLTKKRLGRTSFRGSCGHIYWWKSQNLVSNDSWLQGKQFIFIGLCSETTLGCLTFGFCLKMKIAALHLLILLHKFKLHFLKKGCV